MFRRTFTAIIVAMLLASTLALAFNIQPVKAAGSIYIRADGSIDPPTVPIQRNGDIYTLTGNIVFEPVSFGIKVERNYVTIDGNGFMLQGSGAGEGIRLWGREGVTIKNIQIKAFREGMNFDSSSNNIISGNSITAITGPSIWIYSSCDYNVISGNNIADSHSGIWIYSSSYNVISGNTITTMYLGGIQTVSCSYNSITGNNIANCEYAIRLKLSPSNTIYHNNFIDNTQKVVIEDSSSINTWDDSYPSGGNYWSDYTGVDTNGDGIGETPYVIDTNNQDRYPLVNPWTPIPTYVQGIDVSHHQGAIDWPQVYGAGYRFAFAKASEGVGWSDPAFATNMVNGHSSGLYMGAYHFARPDLGNAAVDEASYFVSVASDYLKEGYGRPVLDLEVGSSLGKETLSNWVRRWMETVETETGVEPIIYTGGDYVNPNVDILDASLTEYDLWIAHWTYDPTASPNTGIWSSWDFWQYSNQGSVPGISGDVDLNLFNGNIERLQSTFAISVPARAAEFAKLLIGARYQFGGGGYCYDRRIFVSREDIIQNGYGWNSKAPTQYGTGVDCSGLIFWSYNRATGNMVYGDPSVVPRTADAQYRATQPVSRTELKPGDLLFFDAYKDSHNGVYRLPGQDGHIDHVAIYKGDYQYSGTILGKTYSGTYDVVEATGIGAVIPQTVDSIIARVKGSYGEAAFIGYGRVSEQAAPVKMKIIKKSPVDMNVTDPEGFMIAEGINETEGMFYRRLDVDGNGELEDVVCAWEKKLGDYFISVAPQPGAAENDTYTIEVMLDDVTTVVAENVTISSIPRQPYILTANETALIPRLDQHDIGITRFETSKTVIGQSFPLLANVTVFNYGNYSETLNVTVCANTTVIVEFIVSLESRNGTALSVAWNTTGFAFGNYSISAFASPVEGETYLTDNTFAEGWVYIGIPGDITGDGKVDTQDLARVSAAYGSLLVTDPLDPRYGQYWHPVTCQTCPHTPNADITNDGKVDIQDLARTSANFGWHE